MKTSETENQNMVSYAVGPGGEASPVRSDQTERSVLICSEAAGFARKILKSCPDSRERSLALTKIEEAVMWANAAIARNG